MTTTPHLLGSIRRGRMQKMLAAATALSAPPLAFEIHLEHYKCSFGDGRPGDFGESTYNLVMGPPLSGPGSLCLAGAMGMLAAVVRRER